MDAVKPVRRALVGRADLYNSPINKVICVVIVCLMKTPMK